MIRSACRTSAETATDRPPGDDPSWIVLSPLAWTQARGHFPQEAPRPDLKEFGHVGRAFEAAALAAGDRAALVGDRGDISYLELLQAAYVVRDQLFAQAGITVGDRVLVLLPNGAEYAAAFYGTLLAGGIAVPLPPDAEETRLRHIISSTTPLVVLTSQNVLRRRRLRLDDDPAILELNDIGKPTGRSDPLPEASQPAAIFFTSGSSGEPKGVTLSHANLLANAASIIEYLGITSEDRALGLLPFYHAFGNSVLQTHVLMGASLVLAGSTLFPETILDAVRSHAVTSVSGVPSLFQTIMSRTSLGEIELPSLKYLAVAGGRLDPDHAQRLAFRVAPAKLVIMYGQTEATARLSYLPAEELESRYGSIGRGIPGVELEVVDERGERIAAGETGEIRARGPNVMLGYWNDPAATAEVLRDEWLYTGDLATIDDEGFIYPQGRKSGLVKVAGYRVHPAEIEDFIRREADVLEAVVVHYESEMLGTRFALFAQPWASDEPVTAEALRSLCASGLPRHKVPEHIEVLDRLPLNDAHKVDRRSLRRRAEAAALTR
jgi:acyl-CoA synthetase (AMP-forming)/AMP-acid ligase II